MRSAISVFAAAALALTGCGGGGDSGSAAEGKIAFTREGAIYVIDADGSGLRKLTNGSITARDYDPTWSPDGTRIAFARTCSIYTMRADGSDVTKVTTPDPCAYEPAWSPDATKIAFSRLKPFHRFERAIVYVVNLDGTGEHPVSQKAFTETSTADEYPAWSPDGRLIAFSRYRYDFSGQMDNPAIWVMGVDGEGQHRATRADDAVGENMPAWAPDGGQIAYGRGNMMSGDMAVYLLKADGSRQQKLPADQFTAMHPSWSPDGRWVVFAGRGIAVMKPDGSGYRLLTKSTSDDMPDWQPRGKTR